MVEPQKGVCKPADGYPVTKNMGYEDVGFRCCRGEEWLPTSKVGEVVTVHQEWSALETFVLINMSTPIKNLSHRWAQ